MIAPFAPAVERLDEIPGVGTTAARVIIDEVGMDVSRFPTAAHLASWAQPIAAPCDQPVAAVRSRYGRITSALRCPRRNRTTGMWLASAWESTARRNRCSIRSSNASEGIRLPRAGSRTPRSAHPLAGWARIR
ncbi:MAG: transposase [Pseudonocardiales bacterium]|nr:transposase [Pseudonocardiales bacterium]